MKRLRRSTGADPSTHYGHVTPICDPYLISGMPQAGIDIHSSAFNTGYIAAPEWSGTIFTSPMNARSPLSPISQSSYGSNTNGQSQLHPLDGRLADNISTSHSCTSDSREPSYNQGPQPFCSDNHPSMHLPVSNLGSSIINSGLQSPHRDHHVSYQKNQFHVGNSNVRHMLQQLEHELLGSDDEVSPDFLAFVHHDDLVGVQNAGLGKQKPNTAQSTKGETMSKQQQPISNSTNETVDEDLPFSTSRMKKSRTEKNSKVGNLSGSPHNSQNANEDSHHESNDGCEAEHLLIACAAAIADGKFQEADAMIATLKESVSIHGDPIERLAAYMVEGLIARRGSSGPAIYKSLKCTESPGPELLSPLEIMSEVCPYIKFGCMAANGAIVEAFKKEHRVHILDFQIAHGTQWVSLLQALANRPGGPPHVRITGIHKEETKSGRADDGQGSVHMVGQRLIKIAEAIGVPLEFNPLCIEMADVQQYMIDRRPGEALAVNFALQLHHMPDEGVSVANPRDRLLRMVRAMDPKVVTLVEQDANTNTAPFFPRFLEALDYYSAVFQSIDALLPRDNRDRVAMEQHCLARDLVSIIACEGGDRVERHEVMGKWRSRLLMAGFRPYPLSPFVNSTIKALLELYSKNYKLHEENDALFLGWLNRHLIVTSAWC